MKRRLSGNTERKLAKMFLAEGGELTIGVFGVMEAETGHKPAGQLRVAMERNGHVMTLSPQNARELAKRFETPEAERVGVKWIAETLRSTADEVEARQRGETQ